MPAIAEENCMGIDTEALYGTYGRTSDEEIRELLGRVEIVRETNKGVGSVHGFYNMNGDDLEKIRKAPRRTSHTWEHEPNKLVEGLREYKRIPFLVKSSSHMLLKPDIGEVFDAMSDEDKKRVRAIQTNTEAGRVKGLKEDNHFLCTAVLFE